MWFLERATLCTPLYYSPVIFLVWIQFHLWLLCKYRLHYSYFGFFHFTPILTVSSHPCYPIPIIVIYPSSLRTPALGLLNTAFILHWRWLNGTEPTLVSVLFCFLFPYTFPADKAVHISLSTSRSDTILSGFLIKLYSSFWLNVLRLFPVHFCWTLRCCQAPLFLPQ